MIFFPRLVGPMCWFAYASKMNHRQTEVRVQPTHFLWMVGWLAGYAIQFNKRSTVDWSRKVLVKNSDEVSRYQYPRDHHWIAHFV